MPDSACWAALLLAAAASAAPELSTNGRWITLANNRSRVVQLRCVNWYGLDQKDFAPGGLDLQPLGALAARVVALGFNCVRLPWSLQLFRDDPPVARDVLSANADLWPRDAPAPRSTAVMDATVNALDDAGLMVVLDNHVGRADWCCDERDGDGLWFNSEYSENAWIATWASVAARYRGRVVGADLRNEVRPARGRAPTWGDGGPRDWRGAAERCAAAVLAANPELLVVVGGLDFGLDLARAARFPVRLPARSRDKLVYSAHQYAWSCPACVAERDRARFEAKLDREWGYLVDAAVAPVWLGEFGTTHDAAGVGAAGDGAARPRAPPQGMWFQWLLAYAARKRVSYAYWSLDGTQSSGRTRRRGAEETYGLLDATWSRPASDALIAELRRLELPNNLGVEEADALFRAGHPDGFEKTERRGALPGEL